MEVLAPAAGWYSLEPALVGGWVVRAARDAAGVASIWDAPDVSVQVAPTGQHFGGWSPDALPEWRQVVDRLKAVGRADPLTEATLRRWLLEANIYPLEMRNREKG